MLLTRTPSSPVRRLTRAAVAVAAALSGAALLPSAGLAQTDAAPDAAPAAAAPAAPAAGAKPAAQAAPQPDWEKVCGEVNKQQECHISRRRVAATGQPLAQFMIIERGDKKLIQVAVPPVALIQPGLQVKVDTNPATGMKYVVCTPGECLALGEINADFIAGLKKGKALSLTMLNPQGKPIAFDISLAGFTASYDGPGDDPKQAQAKQQKLQDELKKKADAARQQLMDAQQTSTQ